MSEKQSKPADVNEEGLRLFLDAYTECALWASLDCDGRENLDDLVQMGKAHLADETRARFEADCRAFISRPGVEEILSEPPKAGQHRIAGHRWLVAGQDFWLTRNGHGAGFQDAYRGDPYTDEEAEFLYKLPKEFGECFLYVGDGGGIYAQ